MKLGRYTTTNLNVLLTSNSRSIEVKNLIILIINVFLVLIFLSTFIFGSDINYGILIEFVILITLIPYVRKLNPFIGAIAILLLVYICVSFIVATKFGGVYYVDFIIAYKAFIYLFILSFFVDKRIIKPIWFIRTYYLIITLFLFDYSFDALNATHRREITLFGESNFELLFLFSLAFGKYVISNRFSIFEILAIVYIVILSGSRSGILIAGFFIFFTQFNQPKKKASFKIIGVICIVIIAILLTFYSRNSINSVSDIDRYRFLLLFFNEIDGWSLQNYFLGSPRLTPLSEETCSILNYYVQLFSQSGDGKCYSVIFHSYILRVVFDHGVIGLVSVNLLLYVFMLKTGYTKNESLVYLTILLINSLSVSAFNSSYMFISTIFLLSCNLMRFTIDERAVYYSPNHVKASSS